MNVGLQTVFCTEIIAAVIVCMLILCRRHAIADNKLSNRAFKVLIWITLCAPILELASYIMMDAKGQYAGVISVVLDAIDFIAPASFAYIWARYTDIRLHNDKKGLYRHWWINVPFILEALLILTSELTHLVFYVDRNNVYSRGPLNVVTYIVPVFYVGGSLIEVFMVSRKKPSYKFYPFIYFSLLAFAGMGIQLVLGVPVIWVCAAITLTMTYIQLQTELRFRDPYTGMFNNAHLNVVIDECIANGKSLVGIMADINQFRKINAVWGNGIGDYVILELAELLISKPDRKWIAIRNSGDEFILLSDTATLEEANTLIHNLKEELQKRNDASSESYNMSVAMGIAYMGDADANKQRFISEMEASMNKDKQSYYDSLEE